MITVLIGVFILFVMLIAVYAYHKHRTIQRAQSFQFSKKQVSDYHISTTSALEHFKQNFDTNFFNGVSSILDIGCGDGKITAYIAKLYPECTVVGADVSEEMLTFAAEHYPSSQYPNLSFIKRDARTLSFINSFDRIISFNCLHWINDQKLALKSIYDSLKPGGKAFIVVNPKNLQDHLPLSCTLVIKTFKWIPYFLTFNPPHSMHTLNEYRQMVLDIGFSIDKIEQREVYIKFSSRIEAEVFLRSVLTPLYHLPENKRMDFLNDLFQEFNRQGILASNGSLVLRISQLDMILSRPYSQT